MPGGSSRASLRSQTSLDDLTLPDAAEAPTSDKKHAHSATQHHTHKHDRFVAQVTQWLEAERAKRAARREKKKTRTRGHGHAQAHAEVHEHEGATGTKPRSMSHGSDDSTTSLEKLQQILEDNIATAGHEPIAANDSSATATSTPRRPSYVHTGSKRRASLYKKLGLGSDVDKAEQEDEVTHVDVTLDNTKTMSYTGGAEDISDGTVTPGASTRMVEEKEAWATFKLEILKLTHTLHVKGWRAFPFHYSNKIEVTRLSGALTNAVYVVTPPPHQPPPEHLTRKHRKAEKVLLRIYGPQVDIDREQELGILRRLARKNIGPKMLGTFNNGRFEQFFNAQTLTPADLRDPSTSKQIAKRMRELHDGIDLLEEERSAGPLVWQHWTKWLDNVEKRMTYLDKEIMSGESGAGEHWRKRGLVAGAEWPLFRTTVEKYKEWLDKQYEAVGGVEPELVFAHNDVGNSYTRKGKTNIQ
jgi:choline kinase